MRTRWLMVLGIGVVMGCPKPGDDQGDTDVTDTDHTGDTDTDVHSDTQESDTQESDTQESDTQESDSDQGQLPDQVLLISEVAHFDENIMYLELCNPGPDPVSLADWSVGRLGTGLGTLSPIYQVDLNPLITLAPGEAYVLAHSQATQLDFTSRWGPDALPDQYDTNVIFGNGNDPYALFYGLRPLDVFGDVNETNDWYANEVALRDEALVRPNFSRWDPGNWTFLSDFEQASPGLCLGAVHTDLPIDSFRDTFDTDMSDTYDTDPVDTQVIRTIVPVSDLTTGDIVVNEFNASPDGCEYLSFVVTGISITTPVDYFDLRGLKFVDQAGHTSTVGSTVLVRPGAEVVAIPAATAGTHCYGLQTGAITYTTFDLTDTGDIIRLRNDTALLDEVSYAGWAINPKVAWNLDYQILSFATMSTAASANDVAANWCPSFSTVSGYTGLGTPGTPNDDCDAAPTGDTGDTDTTVPIETGHTDVHTDLPAPKPVDQAVVGDLVISEFLPQPFTGSSACSTSTGFEYLEVYNRGADRIDLAGMTISDGTHTATVTGPAIVEANGGIAVLYPGLAANHCFQNNIAFVWTAYSYSDVLDLPGAGGVISIANAGGTLDTVDSTSWSPTSWQGQAWSLSSQYADVTANDDFAHWCNGGPSVGPGNIGSADAIYDCAP